MDASLFARAHDEPLAARMRPRTLDEFIGQEHILGPRALAAPCDRRRSALVSDLLRTTWHGQDDLARVIANSTAAHFIALNAVLGGVKDIREAVAEAQQRRAPGSARSSSSTRCTGSTRPSRMRCCRGSRTARWC
jgi:putative ATPase